MSETRRKREQLHRQRAEKARLVAEQARIIKEREIILFGKDLDKPKKSKKQELVAQI
jgi:hypothetical protein